MLAAQAVDVRAADQNAEAPLDPDCCVQVVTPKSATFAAAAFVDHPAALPETLPASRWRVVRADDIPQALPAGIAPEQGLQVKTILVARNISVVFPEIHEIGGVRADALRWHPDGLALDVMIPNPGSAEGIALGNQVAAYALQNAERFGLQDVIWRGVYYTPSGAQSGGYGHFDHVHITTTGGGYPTGAEVYFR
ncbi:hypothetical protein [Mycobacterium sp. 1274756.6]|uniref:hypothetical protein n=1 Tax=Mycobacterium sp. 1274756.6 TaxID=1834076 RepID=UPI000A9EA520|nr:hypothetical protein [Mycobacterium sp. 1274756.6]